MAYVPKDLVIARSRHYRWAVRVTCRCCGKQYNRPLTRDEQHFYGRYP